MKKFAFICLIFLAMGSFAQVLEPTPYDGAVIREAVHTSEPIPYVNIREADLFYSTRIWRTIDLREKMNHPLYYPLKPAHGKINLMTLILDGLREGEIRAYSTESDEFKIPLTYEAIRQIIDKEQIITQQRPFPPYDDYDTVISIPFQPEDVLMFRIKEEWLFDKQRSVLEARILGICPVLAQYDPATGDFRGYQTLFWINLPEARRLFARHEVHNRFNDNFRLSFDDVFHKRLFSSYIIKESNVYNRSISDYAIGIDALLESDRIKEEIFIKEHDLWEY